MSITSNNTFSFGQAPITQVQNAYVGDGGRDIEIRGSAVLEETVEKAAVEEDDNFSEVLPMMAYTLAKRNPAEAEAWLKNFEARPDVDDFTVDVDELRAVIEKAKTDP